MAQFLKPAIANRIAPPLLDVECLPEDAEAMAQLGYRERSALELTKQHDPLFQRTCSP